MNIPHSFIQFAEQFSPIFYVLVLLVLVVMWAMNRMVKHTIDQQQKEIDRLSEDNRKFREYFLENIGNDDTSKKDRPKKGEEVNNVSH